MSGIERARTGSSIAASVAAASINSGLPTRTRRALVAIDRRALMRVTNVEAEGIVQTVKLQEIDALSREAMSGHAVLHRWASVLAAGDPFLADDLKFFLDVAKLGKSEIIADTIDSYCRESRS